MKYSSSKANMIKPKFKKSFFVFLVAISSISLPIKRHITVWLIGDSTMCQYDSSRFPLTGWGMKFAEYFDSSVTIENKAKGGRSTRTFLSENRWQPIVSHLSAGDYVFIQFGHNDESKNYPDRYTTPEDYQTNLVKFIAESRAKKAFPVLVTPVSRRKFDALGQAMETHQVYSGIVRKIAGEYDVPLIDLDSMSIGLLQQFGPRSSQLLFMQLAPGENPNYPLGVHDNTHFNTFGARHMAELVLQRIKKLNLGLSESIIENKTQK